MLFKVSSIEVNPKSPFESDALNRKPTVELLTSLLSEVQGPFVLCIDSPWGTGKTTLLKILKAHLENQNFSCVGLNAWETDFSLDPLVSFLGELSTLQKENNASNQRFNEHFAKAKKIASVIARRTLPVAGKIATAGLLDLTEVTEAALSELVEEGIKDAVDAYVAEKKLLGTFHSQLTLAVDGISGSGKNKSLIVFIDELDRCKPTYAINVLERIKHLFNVTNVVFVLAIDKQQLGVSLKAVYGEGLNVSEYLRRFFDLEFNLPQANTSEFTKFLFNRFSFLDFFNDRSNQGISYDWSQIETVFNSLSDLFELSLRAREQCFTHLRLAFLHTPKNYHLYPILLATLIIIKISRPDSYKSYVIGNGTASEVLKCINSRPGGTDFLSSQLGMIIEANLIVAKKNLRDEPIELTSYKDRLRSAQLSEKEASRINNIISMVEKFNWDGSPSIEYVASKIDLAANFR